jgi:hypothetical protein
MDAKLAQSLIRIMLRTGLRLLPIISPEKCLLIALAQIP